MGHLVNVSVLPSSFFLLPSSVLPSFFLLLSHSFLPLVTRSLPLVFLVDCFPILSSYFHSFPIHSIALRSTPFVSFLSPFVSLCVFPFFPVFPSVPPTVSLLLVAFFCSSHPVLIVPWFSLASFLFFLSCVSWFSLVFTFVSFCFFSLFFHVFLFHVSQCFPRFRVFSCTW